MTVRTPSAPGHETDPPGEAGTMRIGEAAKACGVTTRTLRYWQEMGLLTPGGQREGGERLYTESEVARAARIKELQGLLGLSLAEIREVLDTENVLESIRTAYRATVRPELQRQLVSDAMEANDRLLARLNDSLQRITAFRDERTARAKRLRARARELDTGILRNPSSAGAKSRPGARTRTPQGRGDGTRG